MGNPVIDAYFSDSIVKKSPHIHDCHQILLILKGEVEVTVRQERMRASAGSILLFSRYENHSLRICSEDYERYVLRIAPSGQPQMDRLYALLAHRPEGFSNVLNASACFDSVLAIFEALVKERAEKAALDADMQQLLVHQLLIRIYRLLPRSLFFLEQEGFEQVAEIRRCLEEHYEEKYTLEGLARQFNISSSTLSHQFKKMVGRSVMDYLLFCRLAAAKRMLAETGYSIGEIVDRCGFSDSSNFSRTFKRIQGESPRAFRRRYGGAGPA